MGEKLTKSKYFENSGIRVEYFRDYYRRNKDRINQQATERAKAHPEEKKENARRYYQEHKEEVIRKVKKYQKKYRVGKYSKRAKTDRDACREKLKNAKTEREKKTIRKQYHDIKKSAITLLNRKAAERREKDMLNKKQKYEDKVNRAIDARKEEVLNSKSNTNGSTNTTTTQGEASENGSSKKTS